MLVIVTGSLREVTIIISWNDDFAKLILHGDGGMGTEMKYTIRTWHAYFPAKDCDSYIVNNGRMIWNEHDTQYHLGRILEKVHCGTKTEKTTINKMGDLLEKYFNEFNDLIVE